jgi:uncharacterized membrane protein YphA (DoxX/SURF4 family)
VVLLLAPVRAVGRVGLARLAAAAPAGTLVPTTLAGHPYWRIADPAARRQQRTHFYKNVGMLGGALLFMSGPPAGCR